MSKQYGPIFSFSVCGTRIVVLNTHQYLKEAFVKNSDLFSLRAKNLFTDMFVQGKGKSSFSLKFRDQLDLEILILLYSSILALLVYYNLSYAISFLYTFSNQSYNAHKYFFSNAAFPHAFICISVSGQSQ